MSEMSNQNFENNGMNGTRPLGKGKVFFGTAARTLSSSSDC